MELKLDRPLAFIDLETTGVNVGKDRIIEIGIIRVSPDGTEEMYLKRIDPEMPIPEETIEFHGIFDEDVAGEPTFSELAEEIRDFLKDCDLAGFNSNKMDIPLLVEEFLRADVDFDIRSRKLVDVQNIFHKMEPRNLAAAYKFYCGKPLENAHSAEADARAAMEILKAQLDKYKDVPYVNQEGATSMPVQNDVGQLSDFSTLNRNVDMAGHIVLNDEGIEVFNFGKYKGKSVESIFEKEPAYYGWMMNASFPLYTKKVIDLIMTRFKLSKMSQKAGRK